MTNGVAARGSLRTLRVVRRGLTLTARLHAARTLTRDERALLAAAASLTRAAGTRRSRGLGAVSLRIRTPEDENRPEGTLHTHEQALADFEALLQNQPHPVEEAQDSTAEHFSSNGGVAVAATADPMPLEASRSTDEVFQVRLTIDLLEPLLIRGPGAEPNTAQTVLYIPGSTLRGALATALLNSDAAGSADLAVNPLARALLFDGSVHMGPALPLTKRGRALPTPRSVYA